MILLGKLGNLLRELSRSKERLIPSEGRKIFIGLETVCSLSFLFGTVVTALLLFKVETFSLFSSTDRSKYVVESTTDVRRAKLKNAKFRAELEIIKFFIFNIPDFNDLGSSLPLSQFSK